MMVSFWSVSEAGGQVFNANAEASSWLTEIKNKRALVDNVCNGSLKEIQSRLEIGKGLITTRSFFTTYDIEARFSDATLLHLACFRKGEESKKIVPLLIASAKKANFDIVNEVTTVFFASSLTYWTALDFIINNIANINLAPCFFEEGVLFPKDESAASNPPLFKMINNRNLSLIEMAFVWASSKHINLKKTVLLNSIPTFPAVIADLVVDYAPYIDCEDVRKLANQKSCNETALATAVRVEELAIADFLREMGAVDSKQSSEAAAIK